MNMDQNNKSKLINNLDFLADAVLLNLLFILCCLPVFTIGSAFSSLLTISRRDENQTVSISAFLKEFRKNLKRMVPFWTVILMLSIMLILSLIQGFRRPELSSSALRIISSVLLWLFLGTAAQGFLFYTVFECTLSQIFVNSLRMCIAWPVRSTILILFDFLPLGCLVYSPVFCIYLLPVWLLIYYYLAMKLENFIMKMPIAICRETFKGDCI